MEASQRTVTVTLPPGRKSVVSTTVVLGANAADELGITETGARVFLGGRWFSVAGILGPGAPAPSLAGTALGRLRAAGRVRRGERVIDPELAAEAWASDPDPLTDRERQILWRAGEGRSGAEIAAELSLSEGTVRNYLSEAISKLGAANRVEAARIARQKGWL